MEAQHKILIVDDEQRNLNVLADSLKSDYKIMMAMNGEQALKAVRAINPPDLILLDITIPDMDGYELCRRLKADETIRDIPVIIMAADREIRDEIKGLTIGAADYLSKPISPPILKARIKTQLDLKDSMVEMRRAHKKLESLKDRMEKELTVGRKIQMSLMPLEFPAFPDHDEFNVYAALQPAREVGGDFYDFFFIDEDRFCFYICDVSGKGVPAALFMAVTKTLIKSRAIDDSSTASILTHVNQELIRVNKASMSVSLFMGILNIKTGVLLYTNAGHKPPYFKRAKGVIDRLDRLHGPVAGTAKGLVYKEDSTVLSKEDILLIYTDGVTSANNKANNMFSEKRLAEFLASRDYESVEDIVRSTVSEIKRFEDGADQTDDRALLAVQFLKAPQASAGPKLELTVQNRLLENSRVKQHFNTFSEHYNIPEPVRLKMNVVLDELLTNIISYAYHDDKEHDIEIKVDLSADRLKVSLVDDGVPFNPFGVETPDTSLALEERKIGGLGIHLVRNIMDKVSYRRRIDKNVITVVEYL